MHDKSVSYGITIIFEPIETNSIRLSKSKVIAGAKISYDDVSYLITDAKSQIQQRLQNDFIVHILAIKSHLNILGMVFLIAKL